MRRILPRFLGLSGSLLLGSLLLVGALVAAPQSASAQVIRYSTTQPGDVIAVGNTLGLSHQLGLNGPGVQDSIGTFISLDANAIDNTPPNLLNPWGTGTTKDWTHNGSTATVTFPNPEVQVLYAELVWGGSYNYGGENVSASLDTPVTLAFGGDSLVVTPDPVTSNTINYPLPGAGVLGQYYNRSANVTAFVKSHFAGTYSVSGVPGTQSELINSLNAAGWTLVIAYRYDGDPIRNMSVFVGNNDLFVDENTTVDYAVDGFCAPPSGDIKGTIAIAAVEGDANRVGDQLLIAPNTASTFVNLSGPNNPTNNFFASQINGADGLLDQSGSFGTLNQDAINGTDNILGGRQGWDVTTIQVSSTDNQLFPNQTSAVLRTSTQGDSYMPVLSALAIDVNAPKFSYGNSTSGADKTQVHPGDVITFTAKLDNEGKASADHVHFTLALASGLALSGFSTDGTTGDINGNAVAQGDLTTGVDMGNVTPGTTRVAEVKITVGQTTANPIILKPIWNYDYLTCANQAAIPESFNGATVSVEFQGNTSTTSTSTSTASMGQGGAQNGSGGAGGSASSANGGAGGGGNAFAQGGGFCAASPAGRLSSTGSLVGIGLAAALFAARRRRRVPSGAEKKG